VRFEVLLEASRLAKKPSEREHVTPFVYSQQHRYKVAPLVCPIEGLESERWTVDDARDFAFAEAIVAELGEPSSYVQIMNLLARKPELREINALAKRNEGYDKSLRADAQRSIYGYAESQRLKSAAEKFIPLASQTFSKAHIQYPDKAAPLFLTHGRGGRVWDVDGNEYVDLVCGLLAVMLGYCDPDVDAAVRDQLTRGSSFSLATELEMQLAELICDMVPCAEQVRYGKNGSDATLGCVRIARAHTRRERIVVCGYHGWHDWYIGATVRNLGVTKGAAETTHVLPALDPEALDKLLASRAGEFAAVIMEPMNVVRHANETIAAVRDVAHKHGALLIFDEIITGFRVAPGGAQEMYGVAPDLAAFGKGIGNGLPISAVVGPAHLMKNVEDIFFSSTFGGEALSLAATMAVLKKIKREPVLQTIAATGSAMAESAEELIKKHGLSEVIQLKGHPAWKILAIMDHPSARKEAIKTLFLREMLARGILVNASHNVCYAHSADDIARVVAAYDEALAVVASELATGSLEARLGIAPIEPIFRVR
jgi:glutamate-1-semialdehyde 2,1-aminomutase/spore coat polysaccharide biosynthesis protein SpsF